MKRILLIEVDIPLETIDEQKKWAKEKLGQSAIVRVLRFKDMEDYDNRIDEYWRFG